MKQSKYFLKTSKTVSEDDTIISSRLLKQAGYIQESVAGRYYFLPAGQQVQQNIMKIIKDEMDRAGAQEMVAPILHPLELWRETNRTNTAGFELMVVKDRRDSEFALGGTGEEMFVDLVRKYEISYKELPFQVYQFSPKFRDELRARGGLLRVREFMMKDGYSFHQNEENFIDEYEKMKSVYSKIFERLGLKTSIVESDNGYIGGEYCHEFIVESDAGESKYFTTTDGSYSAHEDIAKFDKQKFNITDELLAMTEVEAKRGPTMDDGVAFHALPLWQQIKDVLFVDKQGRFILCVIRGDLDVNEVKVQHLVNTTELRHATGEEIRRVVHSEPGFISPIGIKNILEPGIQMIIVADDSLRFVRNMYGGANKLNFDTLNMNIGRDFEPDIEGDIAMAKIGFQAPDNKGMLEEKKGIEVGNIFQLGYHYTKLMKGADFTDADGSRKPFYMGCYGIGVGRTMAAIVEKYNDEKGILWPHAVAPFNVHLIGLNTDKPEVQQAAENLYNKLLAAGVTVLYDDREASAGVKFADSDLIGIPMRIVVSTKTLAQSSVELKKRNETTAEMVPLEEIAARIIINLQK